MRTLLILFSVLSVNLAYAKPLQLTCDFFVDENKYSDDGFGEKYGFEVGDIWITNIYNFDSDDFDSPKKVALFNKVYYKGLIALMGGVASQKTIPYTVNPLQITFNSDSEYPASIDRKTLEYTTKRVTPYKCRITEIDTSDNLF